MKSALIALTFVAIAGALWLVVGSSMQVAPAYFAASGNLVKDTPGLVPNTWYLSYEEPGKPAQTMPLVFDAQSRCGVDGGTTKTCDMSFDVGTRVTVSGELLTGAVRVRELQVAVPHDTGKTVSMYYYDPNKDLDETGNVMCSKEGLVRVERVLPSDISLEELLRLHLRGEISETERQQGITTEFPLQGLALVSARIDNGMAILTFDDPDNKTSGGACRVGVLWEQIAATAMQFEGVTDVRFEPDTLFQP